MKYAGVPHLTTDAYAAAAAFLHASRPLEGALFSFHFENASAASALAELARFQNPDGGFHSLEGDIGFTASTVLSTCHALHILHELGATASDPIVQRALAYLTASFDPALDAWHIIPPHDKVMVVQRSAEVGRVTANEVEVGAAPEAKVERPYALGDPQARNDEPNPPTHFLKCEMNARRASAKNMEEERGGGIVLATPAAQGRRLEGIGIGHADKLGLDPHEVPVGS